MGQARLCAAAAVCIQKLEIDTAGFEHLNITGSAVILFLGTEEL